MVAAHHRAAMALSFLPRWKAAPVPLRVVVRARDAAAFIERYRDHVAGDRIFIFTRMPPCAGTRVRFQIHLATGDCVLRGEGTVVRALPEAPAQAGGMELKFVATDEASRALVSAMRAPRRDGVPVAGPAPRRAERGTPAAAVDTPSAAIELLHMADGDIDYLVDWSNDAARPASGARGVTRR